MSSPIAGAHAEASFAQRVRKALAWRWGTQVIAQIITWSSTIAVVRLLEPTDYGLFAMAQVVLIALAFLNGQSFATSLIQASHVDDRRIGQVFALLLMLNGTLACVQFLIAPLAADYFTEPLVADMLRIQAVLFLAIPFSALPQELLARRLEFRKQGLVNVACAAAWTKPRPRSRRPAIWSNWATAPSASWRDRPIMAIRGCGSTGSAARSARRACPRRRRLSARAISTSTRRSRQSMPCSPRPIRPPRSSPTTTRWLSRRCMLPTGAVCRCPATCR
ncbi:oligosaccharide flippase family protein [Leptolyngbya sp. 15MV]|nr:oligosaccharide flippase family protein [Leptolyngbya sp. 15MV]